MNMRVMNIWKNALYVACVVGLAGASSAQSLADVAKKEKERRDTNQDKEVRVVDDAELSRATGVITSVSGSAASAAPPSSSGETASSATEVGESPASSEACAELARVEKEIAQVKRAPQVTRPSRPTRSERPRSTAGMVTGVDGQGNIERQPAPGARSMRIPRKERPTNHSAYQADRLAKLKAEWAKLRGQCSR